MAGVVCSFAILKYVRIISKEARLINIVICQNISG
jgi:hypothetical protein